MVADVEVGTDEWTCLMYVIHNSDEVSFIRLIPLIILHWQSLIILRYPQLSSGSSSAHINKFIAIYFTCDIFLSNLA